MTIDSCMKEDLKVTERLKLIQAIGARLYKDGRTSGEIRKVIKSVACKSIEELEEEFVNCLSIPRAENPKA